MNFYVYPYKTGSASAKAIANAVGGVLLRRENSKFIGSATKTVLNWGAQNVSSAVSSCRLVNNPVRLHDASNKRTFFSMLQHYNEDATENFQVPHPKVFFTYQSAYEYWMDQPVGTCTIVARTILNGHSGAGIVLLTTPADWANFQGTPCNLFTVYIKKLSEFRLHFTDFSSFSAELTPKIFFAQRKGLKTGQDVGANHKVRNLANGYVYVNEGGSILVPDAVSHAATNFLDFNKNVSKMNFGALDIIYVKKYNTAYVLEVNAAPGLSGLTIDKYAAQFALLKSYLEA